MMPVASAEAWMRVALEMARRAAAEDEVPVGAVLVAGDVLIAADRDRRMALNDPTAHAEILALRAAGQAAGDWRLEDCTLFVTLEPCPMCAGAALMARLKGICYGARNPKFGAIETRIALLGEHGWNHRLEVTGGILAEECGRLLSDYFRTKREVGKDKNIAM